MARFATAVLAIALALLAWWLWPRSEAGRPVDGVSGTAPAVQDATPAVGAGVDDAPHDASTANRSDARPNVDATRFTVRGLVLADPRLPDWRDAEVLAYRGDALDRGGLLPGTMAGAQVRSSTPAFVVTGDPIASAKVAADGSFRIECGERHLRLTLSHEFYLLATPEIVHVRADTRAADVVLAPMLGGCIRGRLFGALAADVEQVRLALEPDPMSVMRDGRSMLAAILSSSRSPAAPLADGTFEFRAVPAGARLNLRVEGGRAAARRQEPALQPGELRDVVVPVEEGLELHVEVVDDRGAAIAAASASVRPTGGGGLGGLGNLVQTRRERTDGAGRATFAALDPGSYVVTATTSGRTSAEQVVELARGAEAPHVRLVLREGGVVTGIVVSAEGRPVEGAHVAHQPSLDIPLIGDMTNQLGHDVLAAIAEEGVVTDAEGRFRLTGLADDGDFLVVAAHPEHAVGIARGVRMGDKDVRVELQMLASVTGRVVASDTDAPPTECTVSLLRTSFLVMQMPVRREVVRGVDGAFRLEGLAADRYSLLVEADGYSPVEQSVEATVGETTDAGTLSLPLAASVRGVVQSADGAPVRGALVRKRRGAMADNPMLAMWQSGDASAYTDDEGRFDLGPLAPGRLQLLATAEGHASGRSERVTIEAGQQLEGVVIELGSGGTIRGQLLVGPGQSLSDFLLLVQHQVTQNSHAVDLGPDGHFVAEHLDPGNYQVQAIPQRLMSELGGSGDWQPGRGLELGEMMRKMTDNIVSQRCTVRAGETSDVQVDVRDLAVGSRWKVHVDVGGQPLTNGLVEATSLEDGALRVAMLLDGTATIARAQPGRHRLQVRTGLTMTPVGAAQDLEFPAGVTSHESTLSLPGGELRGRVLDAATGGPLAAAMVRIASDDRSERDDPIGACLTDADGAFVFRGLADGTYTLVAAEPPLAGTRDTASRRTGVQVAAGTTGEVVVLRARPAAGASVLVTDLGGRPLAGATVLCVDEQGRSLGALGLAVSGTDGRAWFGGMANGPARVVGRAPGHAPGASAMLQVSSDAATEFQLTLTRGAPTRVVVVDSSGLPLRGATLTARCGEGPWLPALLLVRGAAADGTFDLGPLGPGQWQFRATHPALGTAAVSRSIRGTAPVTVVIGG